MYEIVHDQDHMTISWLTVENEKGSRSLTWDETISIKVFKRDLYVVDRICLAIELKDSSAVEIDEEMRGWDSLVQQLPEYYQDARALTNGFNRWRFRRFNRT